MKKNRVFLYALIFLFGLIGSANSLQIFSEDFDGNGPGFDEWTVRSEVPVGSWDRFDHSTGDGNNYTSGTGGYAAVRSYSREFIDTDVQLSFTGIDTSNYEALSFSFDFYFNGNGFSYVEDAVYISVGGTLLETIGLFDDISGMPLSGTKTYDISFADGDSNLDVVFGFYSSIGPPDYDTIQIDNIRIEGTVAPVPEPSTMILLSIGLLGFAGISRRKK